VLDLDGGMEAVWTKRITTATRTKLRRAARSGVVVERASGPRAVDTFYEVYETWLTRRARERRMPVRLALWRGRRREPFSKFSAAIECLGDACRVWVARRDERPAAVAIVLVHGESAVYWRSASDRTLAGPTRANDLLQHRAIEDACALGCLAYHMGESGGVASLMHFKERFGAQPLAYAEYRLERLPLARAQRAARDAATAVEARVVRTGKS
jgi:lipid II:glycine glycyltransferase (peptidoglycan interpeptide bridge formation enzyme)